MTEVFHPISIRYNGMDADNHQIDLMRLGESLQGAAKLISIAGNIALTGNYVKKMPAMSVRVVALEPKANCYEISTLIIPAYMALQLIPSETLTKTTEHIANYFLSHLGGRKSESVLIAQVAETAIKESGQTARAAFDFAARLPLIAENQRVAARQFVSPVGESCSTMRLGNSENGGLIIDQPTKDAINAQGQIEVTEEKTYDVVISELDRIRNTCKVSFLGDDEADKRYDAVITDPVLSIANNPYALAMASLKSIKVRAKAQIKNGDIDKLHISNTVMPEIL